MPCPPHEKQGGDFYKGAFDSIPFLNNEGKRTITHLLLRPGCEIGWHVHQGDGETYYILKGHGSFNDNGSIVEVGPGDVTFTGSGEGHALINSGEENLEAIALILYE